MLIEAGVYHNGKWLYVDHRAYKRLLKNAKKLGINGYCGKLENLKSAEWREKKCIKE